MSTLTPSQWIAQLALELHEHWRTVDAVQLEEVAVDLWKDPQLRDLAPKDAAIAWLSPLNSLAK